MVDLNRFVDFGLNLDGESQNPGTYYRTAGVVCIVRDLIYVERNTTIFPNAGLKLYLSEYFISAIIKGKVLHSTMINLS